MTDRLVLGRLVVPPGAKGGPIVAKIQPKPHSDTCWCRPADVAQAALRKLD